jgi:hypothetical protein
MLFLHHRDALVLRRSEPRDAHALERLAALDSQKLPAGSFLLAEVEGELVAAHPLDTKAAAARRSVPAHRCDAHEAAPVRGELLEPAAA